MLKLLVSDSGGTEGLHQRPLQDTLRLFLNCEITKANLAEYLRCNRFPLI